MKYRHVDHDAELSEDEFRLLRDFVHERFGLYYDESQRASLRARLAPRLDLLGLQSFEDYHRYLRFAPERADEQQRMVSHLTNNETYFFREQPQLDVFSGHVLRALKERKTRSGEKRLDVLSAGCSTGEEPLTLAMILFDSGQFFWGWDVRVSGLDVDAAVQRAVSLFHQALAPGGYLFLGHAESLARVSSAFVPIRFQGAIVYQKPEEAVA